jgi:hypothetical protein
MALFLFTYIEQQFNNIVNTHINTKITIYEIFS